ncbi:MAG: precorrin-6Y C5,15-methyltransferase (decarboxylating) subunit CbiT, partial [Firmicutes bacterium]|nr:precorrin-6Y C5,15-methyltransferase (decarboxylating) subunit CbiT [Bacillota bacterium]
HVGEKAVPMTKSEVRAIITSKLRLEENSRLLEIGAGTGSVTIEAALAAHDGRVWALEKNPAAVETCRANIARFGLDNITLLEGAAPEAIPDEVFDRVFIGGSGGNMADIVARVLRQNAPLRIVISAITLESVSEALAALKQGGGHNLEIVQAAVARSKPAGSKHLMMGLNPITIIAADF